MVLFSYKVKHQLIETPFNSGHFPIADTFKFSGKNVCT